MHARKSAVTPDIVGCGFKAFVGNQVEYGNTVFEGLGKLAVAGIAAVVFIREGEPLIGEQVFVAVEVVFGRRPGYVVRAAYLLYKADEA